ncbi:MAG: adenosylcobalamin-dependent ribonucleoside-diphosphate reductase, partial [Desulfobulbia bacterium]
PKNAQVSNAAGTTTGAVSFMNRFSATTREVAQNGRRGALMMTMDIAHPDIEDFVTIKQDLTKVTGANISVRLSDEFMEAVENESTFTLRWPIESKDPKYTKEIDAKELWDTIIKSAHNTAEPGLIFWDRQHKYSTSSLYPGFKNSSTNPCSEIAMQGGDSCRLIAINLYSFVDHPFTKKAKFNHKKFYEVAYETQRLMDDLVDLELEAVDRILDKIQNDPEASKIKQNEIETWKLLQETGQKGRRTGLGFTALADAVAALGLKFDTTEAIEEVDQIMRTKLSGEFDSSIDMAIERGQFEVFNRNIEDKSEFVQMLQTDFPELYERMMNYGRRNISISTVAPT